MKKNFQWIGKKIDIFWETIKPGNFAWRGAAWGLLLGSTIFWGVTNLLTWKPGMLVWTMLVIIFLPPVVLLLGAGLVHLLLEWLSRWHRFYRYALAAGFSVFFLTFVLTTSFEMAGVVGSGLGILCFSCIGAAVMVTRKTRWGGLTRWQRVIFTFGSLLGIIGFVGGGLWLITPGGKTLETLNTALMAEPEFPIPQLMDPTLAGNYSVSTFTYGSGKDLRRPEYGSDVDILSRTVDATPFVQGWEGIPGWILRQYWGFDLESLPLNGRVWMPEGDGPFPLILVVHGNHRQEDFSDPGYDYLGELLASRGMILVSVDQNFLNGTWTSLFNGEENRNENDARGWLLLEHLRLWKQWNTTERHALYQKVDWEKLALIGHSRGGEAVAEAANFNRLPAYPDNAMINFNYQYPIQAVIAIAPVDSQYNPGDWDTPLSDINYLVLQGSMDGDLTSFDGMGQYNRVKFSPDSDYFKSAVYIHGANHGQFNTVWGISDVGPGLGAGFLNTKAILDKMDQEQIAKGFISAFLEVSFFGNDQYRTVFRDWRTGREWLPETVYITRYQDSAFQALATFEEDLDVNTLTFEPAAADSVYLTYWSEGLYKGSWDQGLSTSVLEIAWDQRGRNTLDPFYRISFPSQSLMLNPDTFFVFSMADTGKDPSSENSETYPDINNQNGINFSIELIAGNQIATVRMDQVMLLQPQLKVQLAKAGFLGDGETGEAVFQTFTIPLLLFMEDNPEIDLDQVNQIKIRFDQSEFGWVLLDDLGFWLE